MSHYSVCVTVPHHYDGAQVNAEEIESCLDMILAPFDEQTNEESYCEFEDRTAEAKSGYETETTQAIRYPDGSVCTIHDARTSTSSTIRSTFATRMVATQGESKMRNPKHWNFSRRAR